MLPMTEPARATADPALPPRIGRVEAWSIAGVVAIAILLRAGWFARAAIEHFDEGVYASNWWFDAAQGYQYPQRQLYAPPLLPLLIELVFFIAGPSNAGALSINLVAGCAMPLLVWWVGRRWFGPAAGLAAAILAATSDPQILFSRTALTDPLATCLILAAVGLIREALIRPRAVVVVAAGLAAGLAWLTKYNGWLPLAIGLAGVGACAAARGAGRALLIRRLRILAAVAVGALCLWIPYLVSLQSQGGYAPIAQNHRGYIVSWFDWPASLATQLCSLRAVDGAVGICGVGLALAAACCLALCDVPGFTWNRRQTITLGGAMFLSASGLAAIEGASGFLLLATVAVVLEQGWRAVRGRSCGDDGNLADWLLVAWCGGLCLATPWYAPYMRLTLPLLAASWLAGGALAGRLVAAVQGTIQARARNPAHRKAPQVAMVAMLASLAGAGLLAWRLPAALARGVAGWQSRTGLLEIAAPLRDAAFRSAHLDERTGSERCTFLVYGEPALLFQLRLAGAQHVLPVGHLGFARDGAPAPATPHFVVVGPHALTTRGFKEQFAAARDRLVLTAVFEYHPSQLVTLDNPAPAATSRVQGAPDEIRLYRVR